MIIRLNISIGTNKELTSEREVWIQLENETILKSDIRARKEWKAWVIGAQINVDSFNVVLLNRNNVNKQSVQEIKTAV